jgi:hypothetical protein
MAVLGPWPHGNPMPLSPQERERLAEIEAGLRADPHFDLGPADGSTSARRVRRTVAAAIMLIGIALSVAGAAMAPRSFVVGFVVVLAGFITVVSGAVVWFTAGERRNN